MPNSPPANLPSTPIITTLPTSIIIASSPHLDISRSQISSPTSVLTTNPPLVRVPIPSTSDFIGTHTASNSNRVTSVATSTDPPSAALPQIHASPIKPPCHFYMQGSCKHGKRGSNCPFPHPPMCFKFIRKGSKGCDNGSLCTYAHPKLCQASVSNRRCNIKICNFYHVSGSLRPNHPGTPLEKHSDNKLEKRHSLTPLMQIKLPVHEKRSQLSTLPSNPIYQSQSTQPCVPIQTSLPPYQTQSHNAHPPSQESHLPSPALQQPNFDVFLGQLRDMKHQMSQMQQVQNLMLQNLMNNMWPMLPGQKTYHPTPLCLPN